MPPFIRRRYSFKSEGEAYNVVVECIYLIEHLIEARDDILDINKHRITKGLKTVSDKLSAVHSVFSDSGTQYFDPEVTEIVWIAFGDEIWACYDACRDLQEVLLDAYRRLDLEAGVEVPRRLGRDLRERGEKAKSSLRQVCETARRLVSSRILTNVPLLEDIEEALITHPPSANTGEEISNLILECTEFIEGAIDGYDAVRQKSGSPCELVSITSELPSLLEVFESVQTRRQKQETRRSNVVRCWAGRHQLP